MTVDLALSSADLIKMAVILFGFFWCIVHFSVNRVLTRLDNMQSEIKAAHKRIDSHVTEAHMDDSLFKDSIQSLKVRMSSIESDFKTLDHLIYDNLGMHGKRARDKKQ